MSFFKPIDYWKFAAREDVVSLDNYPDMFDPEWMIRAGMSYDMMRSLGSRRPWVLMEQATNNVNWRQRNSVKRPGVMRLGSYQAIARGADGIMFFQWRASKAGSEKHHSGMVPHIGTDSRVWREVKAFGNELSKLDAILASQVQADVAILLDWENWWAIELEGKPSNDLRLMDQIHSYYKPLYERNITTDFVHPEADLTRYKMVIAPNSYLVTDRGAENINRYVQNGGNLVMSFFSGIVDENEHIRLGGYPAPFRDMLGLVIEEYVPYSEWGSNTVRTNDGKQFQCSFWSDVIRLTSAEALATYEHDYYAGNPAVTRNRFGKGTAFHVGTVPDLNGMDWLVEQFCKSAGVKPETSNLPAGIELVRRTNGKQSWLFILNHSGKEVNVERDTLSVSPLQHSEGYEILSGAKLDKHLRLAPAGVAIVQIPVSKLPKD
jgi:beta-galactosidase